MLSTPDIEWHIYVRKTLFFSQGRHFLIETEDSMRESAEKADDYASNEGLLSATGQTWFYVVKTAQQTC